MTALEFVKANPPLARALAHLVTALTSVILASGGSYVVYGKDGVASKEAQDQCCPIARELAQRCD